MPNRVRDRRPASTATPQIDTDGAGAPAWDSATFTTAGYGQAPEQRTSARYRLRQVLREVTRLKRCRECGRPLGRSAVVGMLTPDGVPYYSGIVTCGSVWACPVCAAKIRAYRADEIARGLADLIKQGGGGLFATLTLPHHVGDELARTVELVSAGFQAVASGRPYRRERDELGIFGHIRAFEVTHTRNGWHPHLHTVLALEHPAGPVAAAELKAAWQGRWDAWLIRQGWQKSSDVYGVKIEVVRRTEDLAGYLAKLQEGAKLRPYRAERSVAAELARSELKAGRVADSRTPFEILADFGSWGDAADLALWHEFERATKGRSAIRWSPGLRARLLADDELTDEQIASMERDGRAVALFEPDLHRRLCKIPGAEWAALDALARGGFRELLVLLVSLRLDPSGLHRPDSPAE